LIAEGNSSPVSLCCQSTTNRKATLGIRETLLVMPRWAMGAGEPIKSAGSYDDNILEEESTRAEQYSEKNQT